MSDNLNLDVNVRTIVDGAKKVRDLTKDIRNLETATKRLASVRGIDLGKITGKTTRIADAQRGDPTVMRDLKKRFDFESRMGRQRAREDADALRSTSAVAAFKVRMEKQRAAAERAAGREAEITRRASIRGEAEAARSLRERLSFTARMARQRVAEERAVAAEAARGERDRAAALRETIRLGRYRQALRDRYEREVERDRVGRRDRLVSHGRHAWDRGSDAFTRSARMAAAAGTAGAVGTGLLVRKSLGAEADVDSAEVNARIYGGLSKDAARSLRDRWAAPLAEALGTGTEKLLGAYTDALKLGVPAEGAKAFAELSTQTSAAWEVPFGEVTDVLGTLNTVLTANGGAFDIGKLKSVANSIQHLAAKQSTTPEKLLEFMKQGAGGAALLGMSLESAAAFGSASTSLGNRPGESGRMLDYLAGRVIELPRLTKKKGDEGKQARDLVRQLGYGSAEDMDRQRRADPEGFMPGLMERFSRIQDARKQDEAVRFLAGREWLGEFGRMVKGANTYREAVKLAKESKSLDAIGTVWELHKTKLSFVMKQFSAGFRNILGEFGKELSPLARQAGDYFLSWTTQLRSGGLAARFKAAIGGFIEGLGLRDLPDLLKGVLGDPNGDVGGSVNAWGDAAKGFGQGLRDVGSAVKSFFGVFNGGDASPETIGRWTARIIGLSAALVALGPLLGVIASLTTTITALAGAAAGAGAVAGWTTVGTIIGAAFVAAILNAAPKKLDELTGRKFGSAIDVAKDSSWLGLPGFGLSVVDELLRSLIGKTDDQTKAVEGTARVLKQNFENRENGVVPFIRKASLGGDDSVRSMIEQMGATIQRASLGGLSGVAAGITGSSAASYGGGGSSVAGILNARPGQPLGSGPLGRRGIFGSGSGGSQPAIPDNVPMTPEERNTLGLIMKYEGGGKNQMNYKGRAQGLDPTTARGYTAQGYFQMLNSNWRRIAPGLGIKTGNAMSSTLEEQTRVALHLLRNGGIGNWANYNPALRAALARGERAPEGGIPQVSPGGGAGASGEDGGSAAGNIRGKLTMDGETFDYGSGGNRGANSIPFGTFPVTPDTIGPWGRANGALGINNNAIWDKSLGRMRTGIEFHAASNARMITAGCIGIARDQWARFRARTLEFARKHGGAFLTVNPDGSASITAQPPSGQGGSTAVGPAKWTKGLGGNAEAMKRGGLSDDLVRRLTKENTGAGAAGNTASDLVRRYGTDIGRNLTGTLEERPLLSPDMLEQARQRGEDRRAMVNGGNSGKAMSVNAPITIQGSTNPEHIANRAAKHIQDSTLWRTHDQDYRSA